MTDLVKYDAACKALALARSTDEVKQIGDGAAVLRAYAKQAKNKQLEVDAAEIRIRAERRLGELIDAQKTTIGLAKGGQPKKGTGVPETPVLLPTLADAGIDKNLAKRARTLAAVPSEQFEERLADWRDDTLRESGRVSLPAVSTAPKPPPRSRPLGHRTPGGALWSEIGALLADRFDGLEVDDKHMVLAMMEQMIADLREGLEVLL